MDAVVQGCTFMLATVLVWSGSSKLRDLPAFVAEIDAYQVVPKRLGRFTAVGVCLLELAVAIGLVFGISAAHIAAISLFTAFTALLVKTWLQGRKITCGCFGGRGELDTVSASSVIRTGLLLVAAIVSISASPDFEPAGLVFALLLTVTVFLASEVVRVLGFVSREGRQMAKDLSSQFAAMTSVVEQ